MKLQSHMKQLLIMSGCAMIIFSYISIFVNLYIWEKNHEIFDVAWYNLWLFLAFFAAYALATKQLMLRSIRFIIRISVCSGAVSFLLLSLLHLENERISILLYALPIGVTMGMYWGGMNITLSIFGKGKEFETFYSLIAVIGQIISITVPLLSALVIYFFGYIGSFLLMLVFVILKFIITFYIPDFSLQKSEERLFFREMISWKLMRMRTLRTSLTTSFFHGVLMTFQGMFVLLYTFQVTENKWLIALLNIVYTLSSVLALKWFQQKQSVSYKNWLLIGVTLTSIGFGCALLEQPIWLILSNICTTFGLFYVNTVVFSQQLTALENESTSIKASFLLWREWAFSLSRYVIFSLALFIDGKGVFFYSILLFVIICSFVVPFIFPEKTERVVLSNSKS